MEEAHLVHMPTGLRLSRGVLRDEDFDGRVVSGVISLDQRALLAPVHFCADL